MRSDHDWLGLLRAEQAGREPKGSTAKAVAELTGVRMVTAHDIKALAEPMRVLQSDEVKKLILELEKVAGQVDAAVADFEKERAQFAARVKSEEARLAGRRNELDAECDRLAAERAGDKAAWKAKAQKLIDAAEGRA